MKSIISVSGPALAAGPVAVRIGRANLIPEESPMQAAPARGLSGLTARQIVLQSRWCHPDWTPEEHLMYLVVEEDVNIETIGERGDRSPIETVERWIESAGPVPR